MNRYALFALAGTLVALNGPLVAQCRAAELNILSAGAVEPGVAAAIEAFRKQTSDEVKVRFATAPAILQRVNGGDAADVVIAPPAVIDDLQKAGRLNPEGRVPVGRVGVGVAVRKGATAPDISSGDAIKRTVIGAQSVVYNKASTGLYLEKLFERLGVGEQTKAKEVRFADGAPVMEHVIKGSGNDVAFGAITEIMQFRDKGLQFVGPLPADAQNYTSYAAAPSAKPANPAGAAAFVKFLATPAAKAVFVEKGIE